MPSWSWYPDVSARLDAGYRREDGKPFARLLVTGEAASSVCTKLHNPLSPQQLRTPP